MTTKTVGRPNKYPWSRWLKPGSSRILRQGRDYTCSTRSMICYLYEVAARKELTVSVNSLSDSSIQIRTLK
jgi:hypothetical protein